jgi:hypothetical protein
MKPLGASFTTQQQLIVPDDDAYFSRNYTPRRRLLGAKMLKVESYGAVNKNGNMLEASVYIIFSIQRSSADPRVVNMHTRAFKTAAFGNEIRGC